MNWLIVTYAVLYFGGLVSSLQENIRYKEPIWYMVLDLLCDVCAISFIIFYWFVPFPSSLQPVLPILFLFSLIWLILSVPHAVKRISTEPEMTAKVKKGLTVFILCLSILFGAPAYFWGAALAWTAING